MTKNTAVSTALSTNNPSNNMLFIIRLINKNANIYILFESGYLMNTDQFLIFFRKRIEPFIALGVLILLIILYVQVSQGNELRTEISQNCGWGEDDFKCFCEKSEAMVIKNKMDDIYSVVGEVEDVWMDR